MNESHAFLTTRFHRFFSGYLLAALLFTLVSSSAFAAPPKEFVISGPTLLKEREVLSVMLAVSVDDVDGLRDLLKDGAVIELVVDLGLERKRSWWSNAGIIEQQYISTIRHDPLTREFILIMPSKNGQTMKDRNLTRLLLDAWQTLRLPLTPLQTLREEGEDNTFLVSVNINLRHKQTPPWLANNGVFWSSEVVPPLSFTLEYEYK